MKSQLASTEFSATFAALVAIINTKLPEVGELLLKRVVWQVGVEATASNHCWSTVLACILGGSRFSVADGTRGSCLSLLLEYCVCMHTKRQPLCRLPRHCLLRCHLHCPCLQFRRAFQRNDKPIVMGCLKFIAHLINQQVAHEVLGLQILMMLLDPPTDDGVEAVLQFLADVGATLQEFSSAALRGWVAAEGQNVGEHVNLNILVWGHRLRRVC